jgi:hypothetical protein
MKYGFDETETSLTHENWELVFANPFILCSSCGVIDVEFNEINERGICATGLIVAITSVIRR